MQKLYNCTRITFFKEKHEIDVQGSPLGNVSRTQAITPSFLLSVLVVCFISLLKKTMNILADLQEHNFLQHIKQYNPWKSSMRLQYRQSTGKSARNHTVVNSSQNHRPELPIP